MALEKDEDFKNFTFQGTESETIDAGEDLGYHSTNGVRQRNL